MLRENYRKERARLKGEAVSQARMVKNAKDIIDISDQVKGGNQPAKPIFVAGKPAIVRMLDDEAMVFHTDGSVRHVFSKEARRKAKKARRDAAKSR